MRAPFLAEPHFIAIPELGIAYGRVPKVANSTIKRVLARAAGLTGAFGEGETSKDRHWATKAPDAHFLTARRLRARFPDLFVFSFVREPMERLASCYRGKIEFARKPYDGFRREGLAPDASFAEFIAHAARRSDRRSNIHYRTQSAILTRRGALVPDFIGRYETLRDDWDDLNDELGARGLARLPALPQRGGKRPVVQPADYFRGDETLIRLTKARYAEDYRRFYPELVES